MAARSLNHSLDDPRASFAKAMEVLCEQLALSFEAHLTDMKSSVGQLLLVDVEMLLQENDKLRKELVQWRSVTCDGEDTHVPAERENHEARGRNIHGGAQVSLTGSSGAVQRDSADVAAISLAVDADHHFELSECSTIPLAASSARKTNYQAVRKFQASQYEDDAMPVQCTTSYQSVAAMAHSSEQFEPDENEDGAMLVRHSFQSEGGTSLRLSGTDFGHVVSAAVLTQSSEVTKNKSQQPFTDVGSFLRRRLDAIGKVPSFPDWRRAFSDQSRASKNTLTSLSNTLENMRCFRTEGNSECSKMDLLPHWEDMLRKVLSNDQVEATQQFYRSSVTLTMHADKHLQWARHPASSSRLCWEALSMMLVLLDVFLVPLAAFEIFESPISLFTFIFWNLDMVFSMVTGYEIRSRIEMRLTHTVFHYVRTWFAFDLLVISPEWVLIFLGSDDTGGIKHLGNVTLVLRLLKLSRLLRILRLLRAWTGIHARFRHHLLLDILQFVKLCSIVLIFNHYSACAWYLIGTLEGNDGWVSRYSFQFSTLEYKYLTSLHWAMSQFHSSVDVHAGTSIERSFSLVCAFVGMVAASMFISSITGLIMRAQKLRQEKFLNKHALLRYLEEHCISTSLTMQINVFVRQTTDATITKSNTVELLKILPRHLREELTIEVKTPTLKINFVSRQIVKMLPQRIKELCLHVVQEVVERPGRLIFEYMEQSSKAFIVWKGQAAYRAHEAFRAVTQSCSSHGSGFSRTVMDIAKGTTMWNESTLVGKGTYFVEAGTCIAGMNLFTMWRHCGECILMENASGFAIDVNDLKAFLMDDENCDMGLAQVLAEHAIGYVQWMRLCPPAELNDLSEYPC